MEGIRNRGSTSALESGIVEVRDSKKSRRPQWGVERKARPRRRRCRGSLSGSMTTNERGRSPRSGNKAGTGTQAGTAGGGAEQAWGARRVWRNAGLGRVGASGAMRARGVGHTWGPEAARRDRGRVISLTSRCSSGWVACPAGSGTECRRFASQEERNRPSAAESQWIAVTSAMAQSRFSGHSQI